MSEIHENSSDEQRRVKTLETISKIEEIAQKLQRFHRDNIESGKIFGDSRFGDINNRADKALIRDIKIVRRELIQKGLSDRKLKFAHALIGRSIFIRYLEDRGILPKDYFMKIASKTSGWINLINTQPPRIGIDIAERQAFYPRILGNKPFTYALFKELAQDFNGDMFPDVNEEEQIVTQEHLDLIQDLLYGDVGIQKHLFFYSYRFDIVPLDLISSIYEEFYAPSIDDEEARSKARQDGAYYTPSVLVELVLSRSLTAKELQKTPRVLDPACGSGIFLVESFRRIVRYEWQKYKRQPSFERLKQILREQIAGIEVNEEAARITAFSLYLTMLHFLEPPAITEYIKQGNRLPNLLVSENTSENHYNCIWIGNAFDVASIKSNPLLFSRFSKNCADIVVSNPPWGASGNDADANIKEREKIMLEWCNTHNRPLGGKEPSQAFLWLSLYFLKNNGKAGMLVSAGVLFTSGTKTQAFREQWLNSVRLNEVINFAHVRKVFFKGSSSPFVLICFEKRKQYHLPVKYWSAKKVTALRETQAVLLSKYDINILRNENLASSELWKSYWFGRLADNRFIKWLQSSKKQLREYVDSENSGRGYQLASKKFNADKLMPFQSLYKLESRYEFPELTAPPEKVERFGAIGAYSGLRVIVNEGISEKFNPQGTIVAQFVDFPFCFFRSIMV